MYRLGKIGSGVVVGCLIIGLFAGTVGYAEETELETGLNIVGDGIEIGSEETELSGISTDNIQAIVDTLKSKNSISVASDIGISANVGIGEGDAYTSLGLSVGGKSYLDYLNGEEPSAQIGVDLSVSSMGSVQSFSVGTYVVPMKDENGDTYYKSYTYTTDEGSDDSEWSSEDLDTESMGTFDGLYSLLESICSGFDVGMEEVDGRSCAVYEGIYGVDDLVGLFDGDTVDGNEGVDESFGGVSEDIDSDYLIDDMEVAVEGDERGSAVVEEQETEDAAEEEKNAVFDFSKLSGSLEANVKVYIDTETNELVQIVADLNRSDYDAVSEYLSEFLFGEELDGVVVTINDATMTSVFSYNEVTEIEVPAGALARVE